MKERVKVTMPGVKLPLHLTEEKNSAAFFRGRLR